MAGTNGDPSWRNALKGRPVWVSPDPSPEEVAALEREFPTVVRVPEEEQRDEAARWEETAVVARCFGRWVAPEAVVREFQRSGVTGAVQAYGLAKGYYIFNFANSGERLKVIDRPWSVNGQIVAVEEWRRGFLPTEDAITAALLWIRLPSLPAELWGEMALQRLVDGVGEFVKMDEFTTERKRLGFARVCIRVDLSRPLIPGVRIGGPDGVFWQRFAYENLCSLCPDCGSALHLQGKCRRDGGPRPEAAGEEGERGERGESGTPIRRGAWMVAVRQWSSEEGKSPIFSGKLPPGPKPSPPTTSGGWLAPGRVGRRGGGPPLNPFSASSPATGRGSGVGTTKSEPRVPGPRARVAGRPSGNSFALLGRLGDAEAGGPGAGRARSKRARLVVGQAGRPASGGPTMPGPAVAVADDLGSAKAKGKAPALAESPDLTPEGDSDLPTFRFSAGTVGGLELQAAPPPACGSGASAEDQGMVVESECVVRGIDGREGVSCCAGNHEAAVSSLREAILSGESPRKMDIVPSLGVADEIMSGGDLVETSSSLQPSP